MCCYVRQKKLNCISVRNRVIINKCTCSKPLKIIFSLHNAVTMCLTPFRIFSRAETNMLTVARYFHWQFSRPTASLRFCRLPLSESSIYLIEEVFYYHRTSHTCGKFSPSIDQTCHVLTFSVLLIGRVGRYSPDFLTESNSCDYYCDCCIT